jgi:geranylgeranyl diphosphate synthase type I
MPSDNGALEAFAGAGTGIEEALRQAVMGPATGAPRDLLGYFLGFLGTDMRPLEKSAGGKGFRSNLCLYLAEAYGARPAAFDAAVAIELFHNSTLIHDDIGDRDEVRRNRPTLWKLAGIDRAMYAGDYLSLMASEKAARGPAARELLDSFREVIEGQLLDAELALAATASPQAAEALYMNMTEKKTGALIGASAQAAGIAAGQSADECVSLRSYGRSFGIAFQLADDYRSVWSSQQETGKDLHSDIRERKRTLPFLYACRDASKKERLGRLYDLGRQLTPAEVMEAVSLIDSTSAKQDTHTSILEFSKKARDTADSLMLPADVRRTLQEIVDIHILKGVETY